MRAEHHRHVVGNLVEFLDEDGALGLQPLDHIAIVDDFVPHIDRGAVFLERALDNFDGAVDTGAETARRGDEQRERRFEVCGLQGSIHKPPPSALRAPSLGDAPIGIRGIRHA